MAIRKRSNHMISVHKISKLIVSLLLLAPVHSFAKEYKELIDYLTSSEFSCTVQSKRVLKPGSLSGDQNLMNGDATCFVGVTCNPNAGVNLTASSSHHNCKAPRGVCQDILDCARDEVSPSLSSQNPEWVVLPLAKSDDATNSLNDKCARASKSKDSHGVFQFYSGTTVAEQYCVARYFCDGKPAGDSVACAPVTEATDGGSRKVCPQINRCLNNPIPMPKGYTEAELRKLANSNPSKERAIRSDLAAPAKVAAAPAGNSVSMATPTSSQNYESRTASIAGSRASTTPATPPASKPPASGHTGRGMK
jgi:hypothetical protein